jgi:F-type H+-transporting ATPase subunit a
MKVPNFILLCLLFVAGVQAGFAQDHSHTTADHGQAAHGAADGHERSYQDMVMEHISNSNEFHIFGDIHLPLPCILYGFGEGFTTCMSSSFEHGHKAVNGYVLEHGSVKRIGTAEGRQMATHIDGFSKVKDADGKEMTVAMAGKFDLDVVKPASLIDLLSWFSFKEFKLNAPEGAWLDFSITKNVATILMAALILFLIFGAVARNYKKRALQAPKGIAALIEPIIFFLRDEVVKPAIGPRWERYFPFICSLFFFILVLNLFGLIPFFPGSANVTGSVATTAALAIITFVVVNLSGNKDYWGHIFWMPGVPIWLKPVMALIEFAGIFIKPFTLLIRLFANISAGHLIILSLVGLIWTIGEMGTSLGGSIGGMVIALPFTFAMNFLELFVAFLQAFIFSLLASLYIGAAVEEHHHEEAHH